MLILTFVACVATSEGDGPVAAGIWGRGTDGYGELLTVSDDASAHLDNGCWGGDIDSLMATAGAFDIEFYYDLRNDMEGPVLSSLTGTIDGDTMETVLTIGDNEPRSSTLILGHEIQLWECP